MDDIELTSLFVDLAKASKQVDELKKKVEDEIIARGESAKMAGVTATYYKPSNETPDYEAAAKAEALRLQNAGKMGGLITEPFETITKIVRWKDVCESLGVEAQPGPLKPARVVIKVS